MKRLLFVLCSILLSGAMHAATAEPTSAEAAAERVTTLAQTPPMGWSSWNYYGDRINEKIIIDTIDKMVASGLRDAGYIYVNIDDGWQKYKGSRADHPLTYDEKKFPRGIKYLADYAHQKGMKLGIYSGPGNSTCAGYVGSEGHEKQDAAMFASWGVDHLKYDSCCSHQQASQAVLKTVFGDMSKALQATGRPIVYHACTAAGRTFGNGVTALAQTSGASVKTSATTSIIRATAKVTTLTCWI